MAYENNHYVPCLVLRRFNKEKINLYNIKTNEYLSNNELKESFAKRKLYSEELEIKLAKELEGPFGNLLNNKILNAKGQVILNREELTLVKKFLLIEQERVPSSLLWDRNFHNQDAYWINLGYIERKIENETDEEYRERTIKVIIESKSLFLEDILKHPDVTYAACCWADLYSSCYLTIWDNSQSKEDFIITDIGMTCEQEAYKVTPEYNYLEMIKKGYISNKLNETKLSNKQAEALYNIWNLCSSVKANFYMFSISKNRMIGLINPFYRLFSEEYRNTYKLKEPDIWPTKLSRRALMANKCKFEKEFELNGVKRKINDDNDQYIYDIKQLSKQEVIYINCLMLDRIDEWLGFADPTKIMRSLQVYMRIKNTLNNYSKLKEHLENQGYEFINKKEIQEFADKFYKNKLTEKEENYIRYYIENHIIIEH